MQDLIRSAFYILSSCNYFLNRIFENNSKNITKGYPSGGVPIQWKRPTCIRFFFEHGRFLYCFKRPKYNISYYIPLLSESFFERNGFINFFRIRNNIVKLHWNPQHPARLAISVLFNILFTIHTIRREQLFTKFRRL